MIHDMMDHVVVWAKRVHCTSNRYTTCAQLLVAIGELHIENVRKSWKCIIQSYQNIIIWNVNSKLVRQSVGSHAKSLSTHTDLTHYIWKTKNYAETRKKPFVSTGHFAVCLSLFSAFRNFTTQCRPCVFYLMCAFSFCSFRILYRHTFDRFVPLNSAEYCAQLCFDSIELYII